MIKSKYGFENFLYDMFCEKMDAMEKVIERNDKIINAQNKEIKINEELIKQLDYQIKIKQMKLLIIKFLDFDDLNSPEARKIFNEIIAISDSIPDLD